jgi:hypothetical protein
MRASLSPGRSGGKHHRRDRRSVSCLRAMHRSAATERSWSCRAAGGKAAPGCGAARKLCGRGPGRRGQGSASPDKRVSGYLRIRSGDRCMWARPRAGEGAVGSQVAAPRHPPLPLPREGERTGGEGAIPPPGGRGELIVISPQATPLKSAFAAFTPPQSIGGKCEQKQTGGSAATCRQATDRRVPCRHGCRRGIRPLPTLASGMDRAA